MDILQAIKERHSVRSYTAQPIEEEKRQQLDVLVAELNEESGLHMSVHYDEPEGFDIRLAHYGLFKNVRNYFVLAGPADLDNLEEKCGYYGEQLVLQAQMMGLNTCWVALTFNKNNVKKRVNDQDKFVIVIALGYGEDQGKPHKSKPMNKILASKGNMPDWFRRGAEAALLAPTAVNQQKFKMGVKDGNPVIRISGLGVCTKVDLGIIKYHFEVASGKKVRE